MPAHLNQRDIDGSAACRKTVVAPGSYRHFDRVEPCLRRLIDEVLRQSLVEEDGQRSTSSPAWRQQTSRGPSPHRPRRRRHPPMDALQDRPPDWPQRDRQARLPKGASVRPEARRRARASSWRGRRRTR